VPDLVDFTETRVLIADDVADTGATLDLVKGVCADKDAEVRKTAVLSLGRIGRKAKAAVSRCGRSRRSRVSGSDVGAGAPKAQVPSKRKRRD